MNLQRLYSLTRQAIQDYNMIDEGDRIAVGLSGGKDSLALLYALHGLKTILPAGFTLFAITVDLGYEKFDVSNIEMLCERFLIPFSVVHTQIRKIIDEKAGTAKDISFAKTACSLCSKLRKGALNKEAIRLGCNKVAYAHHRDDMIDTTLLSLIYEGRFSCFSPKTFLDRSRLTVIRPMMYVPEKDIIGFKNKYKLDTVENPCPYDKQTKREYVKKITNSLEKTAPGVKKRLFHAILESGFCHDLPAIDLSGNQNK